MIMHKPPSEHDEWLEENGKPEKKPIRPSKKPEQRAPDNQSNAADKRFKELNDDIQEFG